MNDIEFYPEEEEKKLIETLFIELSKSGDSKGYRDVRIYLDKLKEFGFEINSKYKKESLKKLSNNLY